MPVEAQGLKRGVNPYEKRGTSGKIQTILQFVEDLLTKDPEMSSDDLIEKVHDEFPGTAFDREHATRYKSLLRKTKGIPIPFMNVPPGKRQVKVPENYCPKKQKTKNKSIPNTRKREREINAKIRAERKKTTPKKKSAKKKTTVKKKFKKRKQ